MNNKPKGDDEAQMSAFRNNKVRILIVESAWITTCSIHNSIKDSYKKSSSNY